MREFSHSLIVSLTTVTDSEARPNFSVPTKTTKLLKSHISRSRGTVRRDDAAPTCQTTMAARQILCLVLYCLSLLASSEAGLRQKFIETSSDVAVREDVAMAEGDEVSQEYDQTDRRRIATAKRVGDDGPGFSVFPLFPLQLCEGDCDSNSDCAGDLVCHQRDSGDGVTSDCSASSSFISGSVDICVKSSSEDSSSGSGGGSTSGGVILRLWWQKGMLKSRFRLPRHQIVL